MSKSENNDFENYMIHCGFKSASAAFFESQDYQKLRNCFLDNLPSKNIEFPKIKVCSLPTIKKVGQDIIEKHTNGINIKVLYTMEDELESLLIERFGDKPSDDKIDEIIEFIKNNAHIIKVTDIPIFSNLSAPENGYMNSTRFYSHFENKAYYQKLPHVVFSLGLQGPCNDFTKGIYVHEMYHALTGRNKGYTKNYLNDELISIFMEKVTALDVDENLVDSAILKRILSVKNNIINLLHGQYNDEDSLDNIEHQKYILSAVLATNLFNTYLHSSNKGKKQIDNDINQVLIGNQVLEDVLDKYEITPEKGAKIMQKQIRSYKA